nr:immunoglobulin light chain junction region [Macaca mulatta]
CQEYNTLLTF